MKSVCMLNNVDLFATGWNIVPNAYLQPSLEIQGGLIVLSNHNKMENMLLLVPIFGIVGLIYMFVLRNWVVKQDSGSEKMSKLAAYIKEGALAFLNAEYRILAIFVVIAGALLGVVSSIVDTTHWFIVVAFIIGAVFSAVAGNIGMRIATDSNVKQEAPVFLPR